MTYRAVPPTDQDDGEAHPVTTAEDVDALITWLSRDDVSTATIADHEDDPALAAHVHGGYGYLLYAGDELLTYSVGEPDSPAVAKASDTGFPAGSGLPLDQFRNALVDFVEKGGELPASTRWRDAELD